MPSKPAVKQRPRIKKKLLRKLAGGGARARLTGARKLSPASAPAPELTDPLQPLLRAATFASRKHHGQMRADGRAPYFSHVVRVTLVLSQGFGVYDDDVLTAALLHDTLEDTLTTYEEIAREFGARVADYVLLLTKDASLPKQAREEDYEARLSDAPEIVKIAKMADLYDNLSDRIHSPKLRRTMATAERLLARFGASLKTERGRQAHRKLSNLLAEITSARPLAAPARP